MLISFFLSERQCDPYYVIYPKNVPLFLDSAEASQPRRRWEGAQEKEASKQG